MGGDSSLASALNQLVGWHVQGTCASEEVHKGVVVLEGAG